jgi:hypothetical protein
MIGKRPADAHPLGEGPRLGWDMPHAGARKTQPQTSKKSTRPSGPPPGSPVR